MLQAVEQEDLGLLNALLSQGVSADAELAEDGTTPLLAAAEQNKLKAATLLIQSGAAINQGDSYNRTPLMAAALEGRYHMVQLLLSAGASARLKDEQGKTALTYAIENEHNQLAQLLLTVEDSASLLGPLELLSFATEAAREEE